MGWTPIAALHLVNVCHFCIGIKGRNLITTCLITYVVGVFSTLIVTTLVCLFWVYLGGLNYPMPFHGYLTAVLTWYMMTLVFWLQCPKEWRSNTKSRKKMIVCVVFLNMLYVAEITYKAIRKLFLLIPKAHHWPMIFVLLIVREANTWCLGYLGKKFAAFPDLSIQILATLIGALRHIMFLSIDVGSITTEVVSYSILAADFIINLSWCFAILWYFKRQKDSVQDQERQVKAIVHLIINESVEISMPIAYVICLVMAYYGPNAEILGNIKNGDWQYSDIKDFGITIKWMGILFSVDFVSAVVSLMILQWYCKINLLNMFLQLQDQIWYIIAIEQSYMLSEV